MKNKCLAAIVSVLMMVSFPAVVFAQPINTLGASEDATEILDLEDELLEKINYGAARGEIESDELIDSIDFDAAYKVYGNSELFEARSSEREVLLSVLNEGEYIWQIPVFIDGNTMLVDLVKVTEIPNDIPEDSKRVLSEKLNKWTIGATYVYNNRIVDYNENVIQSLKGSGLNPDDYSYVFVSGLPEIRYPVAVVFSEKAEYIIPAEESTTYAFDNATEDLAYSTPEATPSNANRNNNGTGFTVYDFDKVARAVNSTMPGIGGGGSGIGEGPKKYQIYLGIFVCIGLAGGIWYKKSASK
uniref:hypothetical protein n=1 Tax=Enterocloster clostridioformis TaxID=1531 RepID=UPI002675BA16|nr:hypothetical protein [Enterocloster clostridioformis]